MKRGKGQCTAPRLTPRKSFSRISLDKERTCQETLSGQTNAVTVRRTVGIDPVQIADYRPHMITTDATELRQRMQPTEDDYGDSDGKSAQGSAMLMWVL